MTEKRIKPRSEHGEVVKFGNPRDGKRKFLSAKTIFLSPVVGLAYARHRIKGYLGNVDELVGNWHSGQHKRVASGLVAFS